MVQWTPPVDSDEESNWSDFEEESPPTTSNTVTQTNIWSQNSIGTQTAVTESLSPPQEPEARVISTQTVKLLPIPSNFSTLMTQGSETISS